MYKYNEVFSFCFHFLIKQLFKSKLLLSLSSSIVSFFKSRLFQIQKNSTNKVSFFVLILWAFRGRNNFSLLLLFHHHQFELSVDGGGGWITFEPDRRICG